jgi:parafibromin
LKNSTGKDGRPKDYYTLECLAFLIKNRDLQHPLYVKNAGTRNISVVSRPDRRELLMYLDGEIETTPSIDKNAPLEITMQRPFPFIKPVGNKRNLALDEEKMDTSDNSKLNKLANEGEEQEKMDDSSSKLFQHASSKKEQFIGRLTKKFDESAEQSTRPITENIMPLSEQLTKEKIAAIKAKKKAQQRKQVGVELDDDLLTNISKNKDQDNLVMKADYSQIDRDDNDAIMKEISQRESVTRTRFTVLQSTGKQFEKDINAFFQLIKAKEDSQNELSSTQSLQFSQAQATQVQTQKSRQLGYNRFDQERYAAKDETGGFSIDTKLTYQPNSGALSLTQTSSSQSANSSSTQVSARLSAANTANGSSKASQEVSSQLSQNKTNIMAKSPTNSSSKKVYVKPIIIIPAITSSLITMSNVVDILQDLKYYSEIFVFLHSL